MVCLWQQFEFPALGLCVHGNDHVEFTSEVLPLTGGGGGAGVVPWSTLPQPLHMTAWLVARWFWRGARGVGAPGRECGPTEGVICVAISLSVVLLLGIILVVLMRGGTIKAGPAVVAILFGFFLASTGMADDIQRFLNSIADTINSIQF